MTNWQAYNPFRTLSGRLVALVSIVAIVTAGTMAVLIDARSTELSLESARTNLASETRVIAMDFRGVFDRMTYDTRVISRTPPVEGLIRATRNGGRDPMDGSTVMHWRSRMGMIFSSMLRATPYYASIRYIGVADGGRELVRVNNSPYGPQIVAVDGLERRGGTGYFKDALAHARLDTVYVPAIDYKRAGNASSALSPRIRAILPVRDSKDTLFGFIVIDADYAALVQAQLGRLRYLRHIYVVDDGGDYMEYGPDGTLSRFLDHKGSSTALPGIVGLLRNPDGTEGIMDLPGSLVPYVKLNLEDAVSDAHIVVGVDVPKAQLLAVAAHTRSQSIALSLMLLILCALGGVFAARKLTAPLRKMTAQIGDAASGETRLSLPTARSDEIGDLARAFEDLTVRRQDALDKLRLLVDTAIYGIITINEFGIVESYNPACEMIFGYTAAEVIGQNINMLMPEPHRSAHDGYLEAHRTTGKSRLLGIQRELVGRRKDGSIVPLELAVSALRSSNRPTFAGVIRDMSERKQMDAVKNNFIATVNHELRSPLTSIKTSLEIIDREYAEALDEEGRHILGMALRNSERLNRIVDDFLDLEKITSGKLSVDMKRTEVGALVRDIVDRHRHYATKHGVSFKLDLDPAETYCFVDPHRFNQALVNLMSNAAKFSRPGSAVTIGMRRQSAGIVEVFVKDTGAGIPGAFRGRIFERFAQADNSSQGRGGSGLGLNITKHLIEAMGGSVGFDSVEGMGSTFFLRLPLCEVATVTEGKTWAAA